MEITEKTLEKAIIFAVSKHKNQFRKGTKNPYVLHPISVLLRLEKIKKSKNRFLLAVACVLHDVVEDCGVGIRTISNRFGHNVAALVEELTSDKEQIRLQGKAQYLLNRMVSMSSYALCIKLCDRLDNLSDMDQMSDEFRKRTISDNRHIVSELEGRRKLTKTHKRLIKEIKKIIN